MLGSRNLKTSEQSTKYNFVYYDSGPVFAVFAVSSIHLTGFDLFASERTTGSRFYTIRVKAARYK